MFSIVYPKKVVASDGRDFKVNVLKTRTFVFIKKKLIKHENFYLST